MSHVAALGKAYSCLVFQHAELIAAIYSDGDEWNLIDYGTDASTVIQSANDALTNGLIFFCRGTYTLTSTLAISPTIELEGEGIQSTILTHGSANAIEVNSGGGASTGGAIRNMSVDADGATSVAIIVDNVAFFEIHHTLAYGDFKSVETLNASYHTDIRGCVFATYSSIGVDLDGNGAIVDNCEFVGDEGSIDVNVNANGISITNNWLEYSDGVGGTHIILLSAYCIVANNMMADQHTNASLSIHVSTAATQNVILGNRMSVPFGTGIFIDSDAGSGNIVAENYIKQSSDETFDAGIKCRESIQVIVGNVVDNTGASSIGAILLRGALSNVIVSGNMVWATSEVTANGITLYNGANNNVVTSNIVRRQAKGIYITSAADYNIVKDNQCFDGTDGIHIDDVASYNLIGGTLCDSNSGVDINIDTADAVSNRILPDNLLNSATKFVDSGTTTILPTISFPFISGGDVDGTARWNEFISATASAKGWGVDDAADFATMLGQLPQELQQTVRIKIWAVALGAPIGAGGQMHLDINMNAGASNLAYTTEAVVLTSFDGEEADYVANDVVHWICDSGDDADIGHMAAGMRIEVEVVYRAGADPDGATNAVFSCVEIQYV